MTPPPQDTTGPLPERRNRGRLVALGVAGVLVVGGGGVGLYFLNRHYTATADLATAEPRQVAERFASLFQRARNEGVQGVSESEIEAVLCQQEHDDLDVDLADQRRREETRTARPTTTGTALKATVTSPLTITVKNITVTGDRGRATLAGDQNGRQVDQDFDLVRESTGWKICGVYQTPRLPSAPTTSR